MYLLKWSGEPSEAFLIYCKCKGKKCGGKKCDCLFYGKECRSLCRRQTDQELQPDEQGALPDLLNQLIGEDRSLLGSMPPADLPDEFLITEDNSDSDSEMLGEENDFDENLQLRLDETERQKQAYVEASDDVIPI
jgi:hypothetical protein